MSSITGLDVRDVRFPTSAHLDGSDAMNPDPDYSAAYVVLRTDAGEEGHGFVFTIGRGNDVQTAAIRSLSHLVVGADVDELVGDLGGFARSLVGDSQLRWLGPEKGVIHMAVGAVVNAAWDLRCQREGKPLWKLLSDLTPEQVVDLVDFRYLTDVLDRDRALELLRAAADGKAERERTLLEQGFPAYTTTPGWLGYDDEKLARLCREAVADGFDHVKLKVGASLEDDVRRCRITREVLGPDVTLSVDANQRWEVDEAIAWVRQLVPFDVHWIEEPTSPDDILGHRAVREGVAPVRVATGEHVHNRVMFKQLLAAGAIDVCQIDATRVGGVNENIAILLLAAQHGVPVTPHAGGVGLCELVQHLAMFDHVALGTSLTGRWIEYVDHLHEHFVVPTQVRGARYLSPLEPGTGARMHQRSLEDHTYPDGPVWSEQAWRTRTSTAWSRS
jgi:L-fuconate dehydratase